MATAIFPGSFDPVTNGHLDLIQRALKMFDTVCVAALVNSKKNPLFSLEERLDMIQRCLSPDEAKRVEVRGFQGLLVDFAKEQGANVVIRGLRAVTDFEYELQMAMMNRELSPDVETVFLIPQPDYSFVSSHLVKEVARLGGDIAKFVPPLVEQVLREKFGKN